MHEIILCKLGEVVLKGLNRRSFEMKLMSNIRRRTQRFGKFRIYSRQSTIYVEPAEETCDIAGAYAACKQVFGIIAVARALPCAKEKEAILETAKAYLGDALTAARSFKVESKRADKSFPMSSIQLSQWVGGELHEAYPHLKVDVHHPELTVYVEVREDAAYVHAPAEPAAGGLPIGMGGVAVIFSAAGLVWYVRHGLPERFPPHWAWILLPCFAIALLTALCHVLCRLPGEKYWLPVEWLRRMLSHFGGASLYYLVGSNLVLFTLAGAGMAPLLSRSGPWPWNQVIQSPAGAFSWLIVLLALLWFIARLAGRGASSRPSKTRISN